MLKLIIQNIDGNIWEEICDKCYRMRYQEMGFQKVPATYKGDYGIEGYTQTGTVYQCYFPEKEYTDDDLYENQRNKITQDIKKLINNGKGLNSIGVANVKEWHFVTPEYRDKRILEHCNNKRIEVLNAKKNNKLDHIDTNFRIIVKIEEDFFEELKKLVPSENDFKYNFAFKHTGEIDWSSCPSEKVDNIKRKLKVIITSQGVIDYEVPYNRLVSVYVSYYVEGIKILNKIRISNPELYEKIMSISHSFKMEAQNKCDMNFNSAINKGLFEEILLDFGMKLEQAFGDIITIESISELKNDLVSSWLADCPMDFR